MWNNGNCWAFCMFFLFWWHLGIIDVVKGYNSINMKTDSWQICLGSQMWIVGTKKTLEENLKKKQLNCPLKVKELLYGEGSFQ